MRLVPIPSADLKDEQKQLFDDIVTFTKAQNPRLAIADEKGAPVGPFNPMLRFPQFGSASSSLGLTARTK